MKRKPSRGKKPAPSFDAPFIPEVASECGCSGLVSRIVELEGDLVRIVELIILGDIDSAKFKEILTRRQGKTQIK